MLLHNFMKVKKARENCKNNTLESTNKVIDRYIFAVNRMTGMAQLNDLPFLPQD